MDTTTTAPARQVESGPASIAVRDAPDDHDDRPPYRDWEAPAEREGATGPDLMDRAYWQGYQDAVRHMIGDQIVTFRPAKVRVTTLTDFEQPHFRKDF